MVVLTALIVSACGGDAYRAARDGDHARLRALLAEPHAKGKLEDDDAACLAKAVAERELATAKDEASAVARIEEVRSCAVELDSALAARMRTKDGPGAAAALVRLEARQIGEDDVRAYAGAADDRWRAVGVRALVRRDDAQKRRDALLDASPRVRRSALRALADAGTAADLDAVYEVARLDPEPILRNEAIRTSSAILRHDEGSRTRAAEHVRRLQDLLPSADEAVREDIAVAFALSPTFEEGGRAALRTMLAAGSGPGAVSAAGVVVRRRASDAELASAASARLVRTILEGPRRDRIFAIAVARTLGAELAALRTASHDDDLDVRVPALARLVDVGADNARAVAELLAIAGQGRRAGPPADARMGGHAARARQILADAKDLRVQAWVEEDLTAEDPTTRASAAGSLALLGRPARAAPLLTDADPSVRTRAACAIVAGARR